MRHPDRPDPASVRRFLAALPPDLATAFPVVQRLADAVPNRRSFERLLHASWRAGAVLVSACLASAVLAIGLARCTH